MPSSSARNDSYFKWTIEFNVTFNWTYPDEIFNDIHAYTTSVTLPRSRYNATEFYCVENDVDFIVPDNREGWVDLLQRVLDCFFYTGKNLVYSTVCIRAKGRPIKSFGGTASGSENLVHGIEKITGILCRFRPRFVSYLLSRFTYHAPRH